jgi:hypothetical protein
MTRTFFITRAVSREQGLHVDLSIVGTRSGTEQEVRDAVLFDKGYPSGTYLLLEKNAPVVEKP